MAVLGVKASKEPSFSKRGRRNHHLEQRERGGGEISLAFSLLVVIISFISPFIHLIHHFPSLFFFILFFIFFILSTPQHCHLFHLPCMLTLLVGRGSNLQRFRARSDAGECSKVAPTFPLSWRPGTLVLFFPCPHTSTTHPHSSTSTHPLAHSPTHPLLFTPQLFTTTQLQQTIIVYPFLLHLSLFFLLLRPPLFSDSVSTPSVFSYTRDRLYVCIVAIVTAISQVRCDALTASTTSFQRLSLNQVLNSTCIFHFELRFNYHLTIPPFQPISCPFI